MIIWNGKGIFTFLSLGIGGLSLALLQSVFPMLRDYGATYMFAVGALFNYLFLTVIPFSKVTAPRVLVDQQTGETVQFSNEGTFFFIRRRYWTYIMLVMSVIFLFVG